MRSIWAVAGQTLSQCLRTKVAAVFAVLLAISLAALPIVMTGDGTLAGRVRTFLDYSFSATSMLLSLVVLSLAIGVVSGDVRDKYVFILCVKPLRRWQYILGRWLGIVLLGGLLLGGASVWIYGLAQHLRGRDDLAIRPEDRRAVESEIFTARRQVAPKPPDVDQALTVRIGQKKSDGTWDETVEAYRTNYGLTQTQATERLTGDLRKGVLSKAQSAGPGRSLVWDFEGIHVVGKAVNGPGTARGVHRPTGRIEVRAGPDLTSRLIIFGPVWVNGVAGRVVGIWKTGFRSIFHLEDMKGQQLASVSPGEAVAVTVEPTVQVSYKVSATDREGVGPLRSAWKVENPTTGFVYDVPPRQTPLGQRATLVAPARAVDGDGNLRVRYLNYSPTTSTTVLFDDVSVLYEVGRFETNFLKTVALTLMGLMFLAALGVFAGSALSFPVGCMLCFVLLWIAVALRFLTEAISSGLTYAGPDEPVALYHVSDAMLRLTKVILPDLASTLGTSFLVEGVEIPWAYLGHTAALTVVFRAAVLLALGCWIFHRRELARVQV